jgi:hypothetical protein
MVHLVPERSTALNSWKIMPRAFGCGGVPQELPKKQLATSSADYNGGPVPLASSTQNEQVKTLKALNQSQVQFQVLLGAICVEYLANTLNICNTAGNS